MRRFFELMARDPNVAAYLVHHVVCVASTKEIDPSQPIELPFWLATQADPFPRFPKVLVVGADRGRASALRSADIEGRWTNGEQGRTYVGYSRGEPRIRIVLNAQEDALEFTFL
jgi:hypothetical protein